MPTNTADQQITLPVGGDAADNPFAFTDFVGDVESRLVKRYVDEADRAARDLAPVTGQVIFLATPGLHLWYDGTRYRELQPLYIFKAAETQVVNASTAFVNDSHLLLPVMANARYMLDGLLSWDSGTTGDIKFDWTVPAGGQVLRWTVSSIDTATGALAGSFNAGVSNAAGTAVARGGAGIGQFVSGLLRGTVTTGGTAGTLQLRWAQNASEAVNTRVKQDSYICLHRVG